MRYPWLRRDRADAGCVISMSSNVNRINFEGLENPVGFGPSPMAQQHHTTFGWMLAFLGLAGTWAYSHDGGGPLHSQAATSIAAQHHPVGALAWAQMNCNAGLSIKSGTPRIQMEDLLRISAALDAEQKWRSRDDVCQEAIAAARPVLDDRESRRVEPRAPNIWRALVAFAP